MDIVNIFKNFDKDKRGDLSKDEFRDFIQNIDPMIKVNEADLVFKYVDTSGDGNVSFD